MMLFLHRDSLAPLGPGCLIRPAYVIHPPNLPHVAAVPVGKFRDSGQPACRRANLTGKGKPNL